MAYLKPDLSAISLIDKDESARRCLDITDM